MWKSAIGIQLVCVVIFMLDRFKALANPLFVSLLMFCDILWWKGHLLTLTSFFKVRNLKPHFNYHNIYLKGNSFLEKRMLLLLPPLFLRIFHVYIYIHISLFFLADLFIFSRIICRDVVHLAFSNIQPNLVKVLLQHCSFAEVPLNQAVAGLYNKSERHVGVW